MSARLPRWRSVWHAVWSRVRACCGARFPRRPEHDASNATLGRLGEDEVARRLAARGEIVHARRLRLRSAELDLVTLDRHGVLWIHEVKTARQIVVPRPAAAGGADNANDPGAARAVRLGLGDLAARAGWKQRRRLERARLELARRTRLGTGIRIHTVVLCDDGNFFVDESTLTRP